MAASTQRFGFKPMSAKTPFSTLRQPAGVSPLKSLYGALQNPVSDVLSGANPFKTTTPTAPSSTSVLGGSAGYGLLNPTDSLPTVNAPNSAPKIPAPPAAPSINDLTADPILAWTQNAGQKGVQDATSAALANAKNAVIQSGLHDVPDVLKGLFANDPTSPVLGALTDTSTLDAAGKNPDSLLAQLSRQHPLAQSSIDAASNQGNSFYGSRHAEALANEADQYRQAQGGVYSDLGNNLSSILQSVLQAKQGASDQYTNQLPGAYQRVLDNGAGPVVPNPATDSNGPAGPSTVTPPADQAASSGFTGAAKKKSVLAGLLGGGSGGGGFNRMI